MLTPDTGSEEWALLVRPMDALRSLVVLSASCSRPERRGDAMAGSAWCGEVVGATLAEHVEPPKRWSSGACGAPASLPASLGPRPLAWPLALDENDAPVADSTAPGPSSAAPSAAATVLGPADEATDLDDVLRAVTGGA